MRHLPRLAAGVPRRWGPEAYTHKAIRAAAPPMAFQVPGLGPVDDHEPKGCSFCPSTPTPECPRGQQICVRPGGVEVVRCCPAPPPPPPVCGPCQRTCRRSDGTTFTSRCGSTGDCCRVA
jgi:hypothetical protein